MTGKKFHAVEAGVVCNLLSPQLHCSELGHNLHRQIEETFRIPAVSTECCQVAKSLITIQV